MSDWQRDGDFGRIGGRSWALILLTLALAASAQATGALILLLLTGMPPGPIARAMDPSDLPVFTEIPIPAEVAMWLLLHQEDLVSVQYLLALVALGGAAWMLPSTRARPREPGPGHAVVLEAEEATRKRDWERVLALLTPELRSTVDDRYLVVVDTMLAFAWLETGALDRAHEHLALRACHATTQAYRLGTLRCYEAGRFAEAHDIGVRALSGAPEEHHGELLFNLACIACRRDLPDEGWRWLRRAVAESYGHRGVYLEDPDLASLRTRPDFEDLVAGLPESSDGDLDGEAQGEA